jgi:ketosteroid isomerase-like protein
MKTGLGTVLLAAGLLAQTPVQNIVDSELAFARFTAEHGIKEGFLAFLGTESIVFRPGPVSGRDFYSQVAVSPALLTWYPVAADIAGSGELGYTTGPYEYFKTKDDKTAAASGHYVTIWNQSADGTWKAALDAGISHGPHPVRRPVFSGAGAPAPAAGPAASSALQEKDGLAGLEKSFNDGYIRKIVPRLAPAARAYRDGRFPAVGRDEAAALIGRSAGDWTWTPARMTVAESGDFAYVYGVAMRNPAAGETGKPTPHAYLRIWKKLSGGDWSVLLDLATPIQK